MTVPSRETLRHWNAALSDNPIDPYAPGEDRYVALTDAGRGAVDELQTTIELSFDTTTQLLAGPTGSGKTTELNRLRGSLTSAGYMVTKVDMRDYVSMSAPIDITELLIAVAVAAHDAYGNVLEDPERTFFSRLGSLLGRLKLDINFAGFQFQASSDAVSVETMGVAAAVNLKSELRSSQPFVQALRERLAYHVGELYEDVAAFLAELAVAASDGVDPSGYVLIVDGLEQLQGTSANDKAVQESIERLFVAHASKLKFGSHHLVYTVPTYLMFTSGGALPYSSRVLPVPIPSVTQRSPADLDHGSNVFRSRAQLREVAARRIPLDAIIGDEASVDAIIEASGGHLRDLFKIFRQIVGLILRGSLTLPVTFDVVEEAIHTLAHDFGSVTQEQAVFLARVDQAGGQNINPTADEVGLLARLLQTHMLLSHLNGSDWYEVHPLAKRALNLG